MQEPRTGYRIAKELTISQVWRPPLTGFELLMAVFQPEGPTASHTDKNRKTHSASRSFVKAGKLGRTLGGGAVVVGQIEAALVAHDFPRPVHLHSEETGTSNVSHVRANIPHIHSSSLASLGIQRRRVQIQIHLRSGVAQRERHRTNEPREALKGTQGGQFT